MGLNVCRSLWDPPVGVGVMRQAITDVFWTSRPAHRSETLCRRVLLFISMREMQGSHERPGKETCSSACFA
jgi:hypothetical protein